MRLPCRRSSEFEIGDFNSQSLLTIGCLSFEERCKGAPQLLWERHRERAGLHMLELEDPVDGIPDYRREREAKVERHRTELKAAGVEWTPIRSEVMANENALLKLVADLMQIRCPRVVLDITSLPKRYFCFFLRRLVLNPLVEDLIVTYTDPGPDGYTQDHLSEDVMHPETFPGFAGKFREHQDNLVISVGFEPLGLRSLILSLYQDVSRNLRIILPFPAPVEAVRRQWNTLREIMEGEPSNLQASKRAVIAAWDSELVYNTLVSWMEVGSTLSLAPFGPKPHTVAMALFGIKFDASLWYTQPKVYHPEYSRGIGETWWYVAKWRGVACFDR